MAAGLTSQEHHIVGSGTEEDIDEEVSRAEPMLGGRERGLVIHKLIEEILTGETDENESALATRADELLRSLDVTPSDDVSRGFSPLEIVKSVRRALSRPEIATVRNRIQPECSVYASMVDGTTETVTFGIADAVVTDDSGEPISVIDWKSDVAPSAVTIEKYGNQVREYLSATGIRNGLLVFVTTGQIVRIECVG
jgi:hypothetical protein